MSAVTATDDLFNSLGLARQDQQQENSNDLGLDTFLKLMVTQLNNQDPFKPMENGEFLGQIAQFGTVSGLNQLNESFSGLSSSLVSGQALQAGGLVGREVLAPIETGRLLSGGSIRGQADLDASTSKLVVRVTDQAGQLMRELDLGAQPAGPVQFSWDGTKDDGSYADPGLYNLRVQVEQNDSTETLQTQLFSQVDSVSIGGAGASLMLNLEGLGPVAFETVKQIH